MDRLRLRVLLTLTLGIALGASGAALAQDEAAEPEAPPPAVQEDQPAGVEEITVTARRREENLQRTPVSIAAFTAAELEERSSFSLEDVGKMTANMTFERGGSSNRNSAHVFIRGVGQNDNSITNDPGVGIYVDGVYFPRIQGSVIDLLDIERIEVLRGPQGTLFGKNTVGGAVNVVTTKPTGEFGGEGRVRVGNYGRFDTNLKLDFPVVEGQLAGRFSFMSSTTDGYMKNLVTGSDWDDDKLLMARLALHWTPTDTASIDLTLDRMQQHQGNGGGNCLVINPNNRSFAAATFPRPVYFGRPWSLFGAESDPVGGTGLTGGQECQRSTDVAKDYEFFGDGPNRGDTDTWSTTATAEFELGDLTLKSISAWRRMEWTRQFEVDYTELFVIHNEGRPKHHQNQWSQELQVLGTALDERLSWITGLYWFKEKTNFNTVNPFPLFLRTSGARRHHEGISYAAFGQFTYQATDKLSLTAGARRTHERKQFSDITLLQAGLPERRLANIDNISALPEIAGATRYNAWTPMGNLSYQLTDDVMVYGSWSRGYRSGGYNGRPLGGGLLTFDPEKLAALEAGIKTSWLDNRLRVNLAAFSNDYEDIQLTIFRTTADGNFLNAISNAAEATIQGLELEVVAAPIAGLRISLGVGLTDAEYDEYLEELPNGSFVDHTGRDFQHTPSYNFNSSVSYGFPVQDLGTLTLRLDYFMQDDMYQDVPNTELLKQGKYGILNARANFALNDEMTEISAFVTNAGDRYYSRNGTALDFIGIGYWSPGEPQMYGVELVRRF